MKKVDRKLAIKALLNLDEKTFGHDKGSGEAYWDWATDMGLCPEYDFDDPDFEKDRSNWPPDFVELLMAIGISPQEIVDISGRNTNCFPGDMCEAYGFTLPTAKENGEKNDPAGAC